MNSNFFKSLLPHAAAIAVFALLTITFFSPLLQDKALKQGDILQYVGMSKEIKDHIEKYNEDPLWTNSMFGGMPAYQIWVRYPSNWVKPLIKVISIGIPRPADAVFLAMLGFYLLMLVLNIPIILAAGLSIAFGFSSYTIICIEAGHNSKAYAIAFMAPVIAGFLRTLQGKILSGTALFALALSMQITNNHLQITYYLFYILLFLGVAWLIQNIKEKNFKDLGIKAGLLAAGAVLAVGPSAGNLLLTAEYSTETIRGKSELSVNKGNKTSGLDKDYATQWSYGIGETFTLMIPNFKGGSSGAVGNNKQALDAVDSQYRQAIAQSVDSYFGDQPFTSGPVYIGAILCFLFILGFLIVDHPMKWPLVLVTLLAIMLSWGKHFMPLTDFFLENVPLYNKFRTVTMILVIPMLTFPLLAGLAIQKWINTPLAFNTFKKQFYVAAGLTAGLSLVFYVAPDLFNSFLKAGEYEDLSNQLKNAKLAPDQISLFLENVEKVRIAIFKADVLRSLLLIALFAGILFYTSLKKANEKIAFIALGVLMLFDLWSVNKRYLTNENYVKKAQMENPYTPTLADQFILSDNSPSKRVLNLSVSTFNDASTSYFHQSIGGYHGAKLRRYQELIENQIKNNIDQIFVIFNNNPTDSSINAGLAGLNALNMLNTKYIIYNKDQRPLINSFAFGNAWLASEINWANNADEEIGLIGIKNLKEIVVVDKRFETTFKNFQPAKDSSARINLLDYKANHLTYESNSNADQIAVFSEIYYSKGWKAFVDGNEVEIARANYVLRAIALPKGKHKIEFKFEPKTYQTGENLATASSLLLLLLVFGALFLEIKQKLRPTK